MSLFDGIGFGSKPQRCPTYSGTSPLPRLPDASSDADESRETLSDVAGGAELTSHDANSEERYGKPSALDVSSVDARQAASKMTWAEFHKPKVVASKDISEEPPETCNTGGTSSIQDLETGGVDTLEVSVYGGWNQSRFDELKGDLLLATPVAQSGEIAVIDAPEGDSLVVQPHGSKMCKWSVQWQGCRIGIANRVERSDKALSLHVVFGSLYLMENGHEFGWSRFANLMDSLGFTIGRSIVGRIDVCVDLCGASMGDIRTAFMEQRYVTNAHKGSIHFDFRRDCAWETLNVGSGKSVTRLRIYNKLVEVKNQPDKAQWLEENRWGKLPDEAIRVEFQLRGESLKKNIRLETRSVQEVFTNLGTICRWCCKDWFRFNALAVDRKNKNQSKGAIDPLWQRVVDAFDSWSVPALPRKPRLIKHAPDAQLLKQQFRGLASTIVARIQDGTTSMDVMKQLFRDIVPEALTEVDSKRIYFESLGKLAVEQGDVPF